jgi:signal transduction histidine kinase
MRSNNNGNEVCKFDGTSSIEERVARSGPGITAVISADDFKILYVNNVFENYAGYKPVLDASFLTMIEKYEHDRFYQQLKAVNEDIKSMDFVVYTLTFNNTVRQKCFVHVSLLAGEGKRAYHLFINPIPAETYLPYTSSETRDLFLRHFEADGCGTFEWIVDVDKVFWSSGVYQIYEVDYHVRDISFQFIRRFVHSQDRDRVEELTNNTLEGGAFFDAEFRIVTAKNNVKWVHCLGRMVKDANGKLLKYVGSVRDITRQRTMEESLDKKMQELSRSNRELEEFAYAASHDLQEPLRKIATFSDRLREKYKTQLHGEGEMYLTRMNASAENMRLLINALLDFSRITQTQAPFAQVSLSLMVKHVLSDLELKIEETSCVVSIGVLPVVDAIATHMKQLFLNLITNAIKFRKTGVPPVISITTLKPTQDEITSHGLSPICTYHKIVVSDNGIGFEPQYANRIFQVFQRLHGKAEYPGSGVGLAICKKIMEHHKGAIYAESKNGEGAVFNLLIPDRQIASQTVGGPGLQS